MTSAVIATIGLAAGLWGAGAAVAASSSPDMTIAIAGYPDTVSPPGGLALYRLTISNVRGKQTFTNVLVVHTVMAGGHFDQALTGAACSNPSGDGVTVNCTIASLAPGKSTSIDIFAATPTTAGTYTSTASIVDSNPSDDSKNNTTVPGATTAVVADGSKTFGFLLPGPHTVGNQVIHVPSGGGKGLVTKLSLESSAPLCGSTCIFTGQAVRVDFPFQDPNYKSVDPLNPITLELDMGPLSPPCRGLGGTCDDLRFVDKRGKIAVVPFCDGASGTNAGPAHALPSSPCKYHQFKDADGHIHFEVALLSNDPTFF